MQKLTKGEEDIMQLIWQLERCTVRDILDQLNDPDMPHSTISSVVRILEKKGFVSHKAYGKTYEYYPIVKKEEYGKTGLLNLLKDYFQGSPKRLVSFLVNENKLDLEDLNEMMQQLDDQKDATTTKSEKP
jgi:predicted transcriptional regulator